MSDEKIIELINKDLDGVISSKEKNKLQAYLEMHPDTKRFHNDLVELSKMLAQVRKVEPDPNLKKSILNSIPVKETTRKEARNGLHALVRNVSVRANYKYMLSFSAGLIVGLFVFILFRGSIGDITRLDHSDLTGAIVLQDVAVNFEMVDKIEISGVNIRASFESKIAEDVVLLEASISTFSETEFTLQFDPEDLHVTAFRQSGASQSKMVLNDNQIKFTNSGENQFGFVFKNMTPRVSPINVKVKAGSLPLEQTISSGKVRSVF